MGAIGCPETMVTTNQRCVISQKSEDLIYIVAEARKQASNPEIEFLGHENIIRRVNTRMHMRPQTHNEPSVIRLSIN